MSSSGNQPPRPPFFPAPFPMQMQIPVAQLVFNGFATAHSASEVTSLISFQDRQLALLIMPPSVAKSFANSLLEAIGHYERTANIKIETIEELERRMTAAAEP